MYYIPEAPKQRLPIDQIPVDTLPEYLRHVFGGIQRFNDMQSLVFDAAFNQGHNLLISAPTSAGKTHVALLTILRMVHQYIINNGLLEQVNAECRGFADQQRLRLRDAPQARPSKVKDVLSAHLRDFKGLCVYLTPMKALASEITAKFKEALVNLGLRVLECTGDESPPQRLVDDANVLILTPEKYDVMTRKVNTEEPVYLRQQLLVIDEIHLLGVPGRGPVIETIVARTKQAIEKYQTPLRMVGISATIPNYRDVQGFMTVPEDGLYVFGEQFRPVQIQQFIVGVKGAQRTTADQARSLERELQRCGAHADGGFGMVVRQLVDAESAFLARRKKAAGAVKAAQEGEFQKMSRKQQQSAVQATKFRQQFQARDEDEMLDQIAIDMCVDNVRQAVPTLLFVHSRKATAALATKISAMLGQNIVQAEKCKKPQTPELATCIARGVGFHNAQMDKHDRAIVEGMFRENQLKVVVCTATLAWGVNLPAQTVIIRGTDVYGSEGGARDLDVLDVKQIFGRAGRPQYMKEGEIGRGILLTSADKVDMYIQQLKNETMIESHMGEKLPDVLNSEIVLGNISNTQHARDFIQNTFYFIRVVNWDEMVLLAIQKLQQARLIFSEKAIGGNAQQQIMPTELGQICSYYYVDYRTLTGFLQLVQKSAIGNNMQYEELLHALASVPVFQQLRARKDELEELQQVSGGNDWKFAQDTLPKDGARLKKKLNRMLKQQRAGICRLAIPETDDECSYKINIIIQAFISRYEFRSASLASDSRTVVQQLPRVAQALFEALLSFGRLEEALKMLRLYQSILYQAWFEDASPLIPLIQQPLGAVSHQHGLYTVQTRSLDRRQSVVTRSTVARFQEYWCDTEMTTERFAELTHDELRLSLGAAVAAEALRAREYVPQLSFDVTVSAVNNKVLRLIFHGTPAFRYDCRVHGSGVQFLLALARADNGLIVSQQKVEVCEETVGRSIDWTVLARISQWQRLRVGCQQTSYSEHVAQLAYRAEQAPFSPQTPYIADDEGPVLKVVVVPVGWCGGPAIIQQQTVDARRVLLQHSPSLAYPTGLSPPGTVLQNERQTFYTPLPRTRPLSVKALHFAEAERLFPFGYFNPLQTAMFHQLYYSTANVFVGAPTSCGKTVAAEIAVLQLVRALPYLKIVYIAPMKALVKERYLDWKRRYGGVLGMSVIQLTAETLPTQRALLAANIYIATPEKFDAITRQIADKEFLQMIGLIIFDEVHLIGTARGYVLESIVARFAQSSPHTRLVGMSTASSNAGDIASWLQVPRHNIFNFDSNARPVRLQMHIQGYIGERYCRRMDLMNQPAYEAIKKYSPTLPTLIFVSSRRQTRKTAISFLSQAQHDPHAPQCIWRIPRDDICRTIEDGDAADFLKYGIGIHHAAMSSADKELIQELFTTGKITILICTATLAWGINVPAYMTILKGCEFYDKTQDRYVEFDVSDINQMCGRAGRPQFIQQRYKQWIAEYFGDSLCQELENKGIFNTMYRFDKNKILENMIGDSDENTSQILEQLAFRDQNTPQAVSIVMCKQNMKEFYKQFIQEPLPFESSLLNSTFGNPLSAAKLKVKEVDISHFPDVINAEIGITKNGMNLMQLRGWLHLTYFFLRARQNPMLYGIDQQRIIDDIADMTDEDIAGYQDEFNTYSGGKDISKQSMDTLIDFFVVLHIYKILSDQATVLEENGLITAAPPVVDSALQQKYVQTPSGRLASRFYLCYKTLPHFYQKFYTSSEMSVLEALSSCPEFRQLAVRCQDNVDMFRLKQQYKFKDFLDHNTVEKYMSVESKAYFLFQVQIRLLNCKHKLANVELPNQDYYLDLRSLMDNAIRVCSAVAELGLEYKQSISKIQEVLQLSAQLINGCMTLDGDRKLLQHVCHGYRANKKLHQVLKYYYENKGRNAPHNEFLSRYPNLKYKVSAKTNEQSDKKDHGNTVDIHVQFWHHCDNGRRISPIFKNDVYMKQKPHTYYCIVGGATGECRVIDYRKMPNTPLGGEAQFVGLAVNGDTKLRVVVKSDVFLEVGLDATIDLTTCGMDWSTAYDSTEPPIEITID